MIDLILSLSFFIFIDTLLSIIIFIVINFIFLKTCNLVNSSYYASKYKQINKIIYIFTMLILYFILIPIVYNYEMNILTLFIPISILSKLYNYKKITKYIKAHK